MCQVASAKQSEIAALQARTLQGEMFDYGAIAISYTNADLAKIIRAAAFSGKSLSLVIYPDGRIALSTKEGRSAFSNYLTYLRAGSDLSDEQLDQMQKAFQNATRSAQEIAGVGSDEHEQPEWAKLDMQEFQGIGDYDGIKGIIEDKLAAHSVSSAWFPDPETGKEYLLFRIADAKEVWQSFDELSRETDDACAKAAEKIRGQHEKEPSRDRDGRALDERAEDAREDRRKCRRSLQRE